MDDYAQRPAGALLPRPNVDLDSAVSRETAGIAPLYYAAVECIDAEFGRLVAALEELGLARDTIVFFTSDHGQQMGSHDLLYKNVPWEESMRLPCIVRVPGVRRGERRAVRQRRHPSPRRIWYCGLAVPESMQGRDLAEVLRSDAHPDADAAPPYYRWPTAPGDSSARGLRTTRWKYVATREADATMHGPCSTSSPTRTSCPRWSTTPTPASSHAGCYHPRGRRRVLGRECVGRAAARGPVRRCRG